MFCRKSLLVAVWSRCPQERRKKEGVSRLDKLEPDALALAANVTEAFVDVRSSDINATFMAT